MGRLYHGRRAALEDAADALLKKSLVGVTRPADKSDILTKWKDGDRRSHEVYVASGTPETAARNGNYYRALNPLHRHLNSATPASRQHHRNSRSQYDGAPPAFTQPAPYLAPGSEWDTE